MECNRYIVAIVFLFACSMVFGQCADWLWVKACGGANDNFAYYYLDMDTGEELQCYEYGEHGSDIALDDNGNIYTTGYFSGTASFGNIVLTSFAEIDMFIAKMDGAGNYLWVKQLGFCYFEISGYYTCGIINNRLYDNPQIIVDHYGSVLVTGTLGFYDMDNNVFGTTVLHGPGSFICKMDSDGNYLWAKKVCNDGYDSGFMGAMSVTTDSMGSIFVTGGFSSTQTFGTTSLQASGSSDVFVLKLDSSGNVIWAKNLGGSGFDFGKSIALDNAGNVLIVGYYETSATFGTITLNPMGYGDVFICKIDAAGEVIWAKRAGCTSYDTPKAIMVDTDGNACVLLNTSTNTPYYYDNNTISGGFIKIDASGNLLWSKSHNAENLTITSNGEIYTAGYGGDWYMDYGCIISKWTADGTLVTSSRGIQGANNEGVIRSVAADSNGDCYAIGLYYQLSYPAFFSNIEVPPLGATNIFVAKYRASADHVQNVTTILHEPLPDVTNHWTLSAAGYQLRAWITSRPQDIISTTTHFPSVIRLFRYGNGTTMPYETRTYLKLGAFNTQWTAGEVIHYEITNLTQGTSDSWEVAIPEGYPAEWLIGDPIPLDLFPGIVLPAPELSINADGENGVVLSWLACAGASSYRVECSSDPYGTFSALTTTSALSYTHISIGNSQSKMFYRVLAQSGRVESAPSAVVGYVKYDCVPGLNMIALPLEIPWEWVNELGSEYSSSIESIYYWNTAAQTWVGSTNLGGCWDGDFAIHTNDALFISNTSAMSLFVCGRLPATPTQFSLVAGINAIVIPLSIPQLTMASDLGIYLESLESVYQWDNINQSYNVAYDLGGFWDMDFAVETGFPLLVNSLYSLSWPARSSDPALRKQDK